MLFIILGVVAGMILFGASLFFVGWTIDKSLDTSSEKMASLYIVIGFAVGIPLLASSIVVGFVIGSLGVHP